MIDVILTLLAAVAVYLFTATLLSRAAQPLRLRLADLGEELIADPAVPPAFKRQARFYMSTAFGMAGPLIFGIFALPVVAIIYVVRLRLITAFAFDMDRLSELNRRRFLEMDRLHTRITLANNPILAFVFAIEMVILAGLATIVRALLKGFPLTNETDRELFLYVVEEKSEWVADKLRFWNTAGAGA
jgi:hypothetical protein